MFTSIRLCTSLMEQYFFICDKQIFSLIYLNKIENQLL